MIIDIIVLSSLGLALVFLLSWAMRSEMRARIEKPKYLFQQQLNNFEKYYQRTDEINSQQKDNEVEQHREKL